MLYIDIEKGDIAKVDEDGEQQGLADGRVLKLVELVCRKLQKGKTAESIAEELDEPVQMIEKIESAANKYDKDADVLTIYKAFQEM